MKPTSVTSALIAAALMSCCHGFAQQGPVAVAVEEVVEVIEGEELLALPVDDDQQKLFAHANVQVALVRRACRLTRQQKQTLAKFDRAWINSIRNEQVKRANPNVQQPGLIAMFFGARPVANNPPTVSIDTVKARIDEKISQLLSEEQRDAYEKEKELRDKFRNEATADALIESLQPRLGMTDQQREQIKAKIVPWAARMELHTMYYFSGNNYYPDLPEHLLSPVLDKHQMAAYRGLQRHLFTDENFNDGNPPIVIKQ